MSTLGPHKEIKREMRAKHTLRHTHTHTHTQAVTRSRRGRIVALSVII